MKFLAMALVVAKYLVIMILLSACGVDDTKDEAPATEEVEPDLAPIRTFETTPVEPEAKVTEVPPVVEPAVETEAEKKEREKIDAILSTVVVGDTFLTMLPEAKDIILSGICEGNPLTSCRVSAHKGCDELGPEGSTGDTCGNPDDSPWHFYYGFTFKDKVITHVYFRGAYK